MSRYSSDLGKFVRGSTVTPAASAARTATGNSGWLNSEEFNALNLSLDITAASGTTPTLDVSVETALDDAGTNSRSVGAFTQATNASGDQRKTFSGLDRFYRVVWTIAGTTPSFTFSVSGDAK